MRVCACVCVCACVRVREREEYRTLVGNRRKHTAEEDRHIFHVHHAAEHLDAVVEVVAIQAGLHFTPRVVRDAVVVLCAHVRIGSQINSIVCFCDVFIFINCCIVFIISC